MTETMTKAEIVESRVTLAVAKEWEASQEPILFVAVLFYSLPIDIDVSLTNRPSEFDRLLDVFEAKCKQLLTKK